MAGSCEVSNHSGRSRSSLEMVARYVILVPLVLLHIVLIVLAFLIQFGVPILLAH